MNGLKQLMKPRPVGLCHARKDVGFRPARPVAEALEARRMLSVASDIRMPVAAVTAYDSNPLETTAGDTLAGAAAGATTGAYLQQVDGPVQVDDDGETQFEPASAIKILLAVTALQAVENGTASLADPITYYFDPNDPTNPGVNPDSYDHTSDNAQTIDLQDAIGQMLQVSDNRITDAMAADFGWDAINATAQSIGMANTVWGSDLGTGIPGNYLTLQDASLLYGKLLDGSLLDPARTALLKDLIVNQTNSGLNVFIPVIQQEAADVLGVDVSDPGAADLADNFIAATLWGAKGGSYDLISSDGSTDDVVRTEAGYFELPVRVAGGAVSLVDYTYGVFVDNADVPTVDSDDNPAVDQVDDALTTAKQLLVTGIVHDALQTWVGAPPLLPASRLAFDAQPSDSLAGAVLPPVTVDVKDSADNLVPFDTSDVTISLSSGPGGAILGGTLTGQAVDGIVSFDDLSVDQPGTYTLQVADGKYAVATSAPFNASPGDTVTPVPDPISIPVPPPSPVGPPTTSAENTLAPVITRSTLPATVVAGAKVHGVVTVELSDQADLVENGPITIGLYASVDGMADDSATVIESLTRRIDLKPGRKQAIALSVKTLPAGMAAGLYTLLARVIDPSGNADLTPPGPTFTLAAPFVSLSASVGAITPAMARPGRRVSLKLLLTNSGNTDASGLMTIQLGLSSDGSGSGPTLPALLRSVRVKAGRRTSLNLHFVVPKGLPAGRYEPFVSITQNGVTASAVVASALVVGT